MPQPQPQPQPQPDRAHWHHWRGLQAHCTDLSHCPRTCPCPLGKCDARHPLVP